MDKGAAVSSSGLSLPRSLPFIHSSASRQDRTGQGRARVSLLKAKSERAKIRNVTLGYFFVLGCFHCSSHRSGGQSGWGRFPFGLLGRVGVGVVFFSLWGGRKKRRRGGRERENRKGQGGGERATRESRRRPPLVGVGTSNKAKEKRRREESHNSKTMRRSRLSDCLVFFFALFFLSFSRCLLGLLAGLLASPCLSLLFRPSPHPIIYPPRAVSLPLQPLLLCYGGWKKMLLPPLLSTKIVHKPHPTGASEQAREREGGGSLPSHCLPSPPPFSLYI